MEGNFICFPLQFSLINMFRSSTKNGQAGDSTDTSMNSAQIDESSCSSTSSASSIRTKVKTTDKVANGNDSGETSGLPRHLLELTMSLSSPNLLQSSGALTVSSSSSEADVS